MPARACTLTLPYPAQSPVAAPAAPRSAAPAPTLDPPPREGGGCAPARRRPLLRVAAAGGPSPDRRRAAHARPCDGGASARPERRTRACQQHGQQLRRQQAEPDRNSLARRAAAQVWDLATQRCEQTLSHHSGKVQAVAWNPAEASALLSGGFDKRACLARRPPRRAVAGWGGPRAASC